MFHRASWINVVAIAALVSGAAGRLPAQAAPRSPFMPAAAAASAAAPTAGAPLEYRASMDVGDGVQFRLYDPAKKAGVWVRSNERNPEFDVLVKKHDEEQKTLTIEHQGKTLTLAMRVAKVVSAGSAAHMMPPPPAVAPAPPSTVAPAVTQSVVLNPTPADEQRRLEAVAAEVARRRAMREQATQQISQGVRPGTTFPTPGTGQPPGAPGRPQQR
jgi:hypothetical protein